MNRWYPEYRTFLQQRIQDLYRAPHGHLSGFETLNRETLCPGALDLKTKELMALAIAVSARCGGCVAYHVHDCLRAGATQEELQETVGVAVLMGGAPALVYGVEALEAAAQFRSTHAAPEPGGP